ncbi:MAG: hypothetical protein ACT4QF_21485 [Sporichthyaceae bacterium]
MQKRSIALCASVGFLALALAGCSSGGTVDVSLSAASFDSPNELAQASEYLAKVQITSAPVAHQMRDADYLTYWVSQATVEEIVGQRPDVPKTLKVGDTIPVATQLLSANSDTKVSLNEGAFPAKSELPAKGDKLVVFLVYDPALGGYGPGYESIGQGVVGADSSVTMRGVSGKLNKNKVASRTVTSDLKTKYDSKAPWRTTTPGSENIPADTDEGRLPMSAPESSAQPSAEIR